MTAKPATPIVRAPLERRHRDDAIAPERGIHALLDHTYHRLMSGDVSHMDAFVHHLNAARNALSVARWQTLIAEIASHPLRALVHEEPFARRAFEKPRGYPGDALLLDLIYRDRPYDGPMTATGAALHAWSATRPAIRSVCERREILARWIDTVARERANARILSVACGHLREAQRSEAVRGRHIGELVAVDQDDRSIAVVAEEQGAFNVTPVVASFRRLIVAPTAWGTFDFVYSAGLYDYLPEPAAQRLTATLFSMLRPGGVLLVANFAPELTDIGYMEAIMEWTLIYRDEPAVDRFAAGVPASQIAERGQCRDVAGNVVYLALRKA